MLKPGDQHVESGGEPLAAVVDPDVLADGDQGREAVGRQRTEELVQLGPDGGVADVLLVDRGRGAADGKADGVVKRSRCRPSACGSRGQLDGTGTGDGWSGWTGLRQLLFRCQMR